MNKLVYATFILLSSTLLAVPTSGAAKVDRSELIDRWEKRLVKIDFCLKDVDTYLASRNEKDNWNRRVLTLALCLETYEERVKAALKKKEP